MLIFICISYGNINYAIFPLLKVLPVQAAENNANNEMPEVYFLGKKYLLRYAAPLQNDININGFLNILTVNRQSSKNSDDLIELFRVNENFDEYYNKEYENSVLFSLGINNNMNQYYFYDSDSNSQKFILTNTKEHGVHIISYLTPSDDGSYTEYNIYKYVCGQGFYGIKYSRKYYMNAYNTQQIRQELYSIVKDDAYYSSFIKKISIPQMYNERYGHL